MAPDPHLTDGGAALRPSPENIFARPAAAPVYTTPTVPASGVRSAVGGCFGRLIATNMRVAWALALVALVTVGAVAAFEHGEAATAPHVERRAVPAAPPLQPSKGRRQARPAQVERPAHRRRTARPRRQPVRTPTRHPSRPTRPRNLPRAPRPTPRVDPRPVPAPRTFDHPIPAAVPDGAPPEFM